jgi:enoyl-CoA hydratase
VAIVSLSEQAGVTFLTMDHPPVNAMNLELLGELVEGLQTLTADPPAAVVIAGREGAFSAGADLKAIPGYGPSEQRQMVTRINEMALLTYGLPCPVLGAITGHAIAGGMVLALCADHRVAATGGRYGLTEVKVGVPYPQAAIGVVRAELTAGAARTLALGNRLIGAEECVGLGAFDEALAAELVLDRAAAVAGELAALPAAVYARTKNDLRGPALAAMTEAVAHEPLLDAQ